MNAQQALEIAKARHPHAEIVEDKFGDFDVIANGVRVMTFDCGSLYDTTTTAESGFAEVAA